MFIVAIPIIIETDYILALWLHAVPNYCSPFVRIILITSLIDALSNPVSFGAQATGNIKLYQVVVGISYSSIIPISYIFLKTGWGALSTLWVVFFITGITYILRIFLLNKISPFDMQKYFLGILNKTLPVVACTIIIPFIFHKKIEPGLFRLIIVSVSSIIISILAIGTVGCEQEERNTILKFIKNKIYDKKNNEHFR